MHTNIFRELLLYVVSKVELWTNVHILASLWKVVLYEMMPRNKATSQAGHLFSSKQAWKDLSVEDLPPVGHFGCCFYIQRKNTQREKVLVLIGTDYKTVFENSYKSFPKASMFLNIDALGKREVRWLLYKKKQKWRRNINITQQKQLTKMCRQ